MSFIYNCVAVSVLFVKDVNNMLLKEKDLSIWPAGLKHKILSI